MNKERFLYGKKLAINSDDLLSIITDVEKNQIYSSMIEITDLLNKKQSEIDKLKEENEILKQRIRDMNYNGCGFDEVEKKIQESRFTTFTTKDKGRFYTETRYIS